MISLHGYADDLVVLSSEESEAIKLHATTLTKFDKELNLEINILE